MVSPLGIGTSAFWEQLLAGASGIRVPDVVDASGFPCKVAGQLPAYKIGDYVPKTYRKATKVMARDIELAVIAAHDAFADAGIQSKAHGDAISFKPERFGCNIGAGLISAELDELTAAMNEARSNNELDLRLWGNVGMGKLTPLWLLKYLPNMLACHVTIIHGLMGPSNTITCAEASSHLAIGEAFRTIQRGKADLAICGGAESRLNPMGMMRHMLLNRLNTQDNDTPAGACRPFDANARGNILGEGGGLLILEEYDRAKARGAKIYAEIVGFAASQDTHSVTEPDPTGHSYGKAIENALKDAKLQASDVSMIVPHGLGIASFDRAELAGLKKSLGESLTSVAVCPIKGQIGNLSAGCGVDAATAVLSVAHDKLPPAINSG
ncbi:MAG TPA: beta-ketoacyl synthase N-terminal-like domain-containing protein, partial [Tepidisphaeraceae bacterium]|nr:beta-ketoacyl synthase N-terminal-like domain-containing protein [Tepidisphaeraceae bacterium]